MSDHDEPKRVRISCGVGEWSELYASLEPDGGLELACDHAVLPKSWTVRLPPDAVARLRALLTGDQGRVCEGCGYVTPHHDPRCAFRERAGDQAAEEGK